MANNHKKVKRYRRSFYTPKARFKRWLGAAVLIAAVAVAAWFAAPYVLDWGTNTWYTVVRGRDLQAESRAASSEAAAESLAASSEAAASSAAAEAEKAEAESEAASQAAQQAEASKAAVISGRWVNIERSALTDEAAVRAAAEQAAASGAAYAMITFKDSAGNIYYQSAVAAAANSIAEKTVDPALIASIFEQNGVIPVARIAAFRDPVAAYTDRAMAIRYRSNGESDYLWLDAANAAAGGKAWLNPYSTEAVNFVGDLAEELYKAGFEHIALSCVQFPSAVSQKQDFGSTGGASRETQLAADIAAWDKRFGDNVILWYDYSLAQCTTVSATLGAPAWTLGMENLLIEVPENYTADEAARAQLLADAAANGVAHTVIRDDKAGYWE